MSSDLPSVQRVMIESDIPSDLNDLPIYCLEVLAMLELLEQLGFSSEELCFALLPDGLYWMVMVRAPKVIERLAGDTIYPIKAIDMPNGLQHKKIYLEMIKAATRWGKAERASRQLVLNDSKSQARKASLKVELASVGLLPERLN